jgi:acyl-CoA thioesterase I
MAAPKNPLRSIFSSPKGVTWLLTGDSITHGAVYTFGWRSYPEHFMERLRWELRRMADTVVNTGTSGDTTDGLLRDLKGRVLRFRPDVTSIMMGMNDCVAGRAGIEAFRRNLLNLADASENNSSLLLLHTPNPIRPGADIERTHLPHYADIIREVAARRKLMLVDHYDHWITQNRKHPGAFRRWLDSDGIHPSAQGQLQLARLFFVRLGIFDPASPTCKLCITDPATRGVHPRKRLLKTANFRGSSPR